MGSNVRAGSSPAWGTKRLTLCKSFFVLDSHILCFIPTFFIHQALTDFILDKQMIWRIESLDTISAMAIHQNYTNRGKLYFSNEFEYKAESMNYETIMKSKNSHQSLH